MTAVFEITNASAKDLSKASHEINTGIGFFNHMIDQFNSHAQIGVSVQVTKSSTEEDISSKNRNANPSQQQGLLMEKVGSSLGKELGELLTPEMKGRSSRFCCPLDEALVECVLSVCTEGETPSFTYTLAPYGIFPKTGRSKIGEMLTEPLSNFFVEVSKSSGLNVSLIKIRGHNGHHIVESAFKAFSRALRNLLDGTNTTAESCLNEGLMADLWGLQSESYKQGLSEQRTGSSKRTTKETTIEVDLKLDGGQSGVEIDTDINTLSAFYCTLAKAADISLVVKCSGDTWVDDHHSSEDVSIAIGKLLNDAFGTKAGLNRMWCASANVGEAVVEVVMDLSNRPCLTHNLSLSDNKEGKEYVGDMSIEMLDHVLESLVMNSQMTVHIVEHSSGDLMDTTLATAKAFGKALKMCAAVDPRRAGKTASSKGTLSV